MRRPDGTHTELVREFGFNDYRKTTEIDFKPAYDYWSATKDFWAVVRGHWDGLLSQAPGVHLRTKIDGMAMIIPLFEHAETLQKGGRLDDSQIDSVFAEWAEPANATLEER